MVYNPRITGIALITTDLRRACAFYELALGFVPVSSARYDSAEVATLRLGEETLNLVRPDRLGRAYPVTGEDLPSATLRDPDGHIIANQLW